VTTREAKRRACSLAWRLLDQAVGLRELTELFADNLTDADRARLTAAKDELTQELYRRSVGSAKEAVS
jgi:hypothetical protein